MAYLANIPVDFASEKLAFEWMYGVLARDENDDCIDNRRFAFEDDAAAVARYEEQEQDGCCGFFDRRVQVNGRYALVGCNFGH